MEQDSPIAASSPKPVEPSGLRYTGWGAFVSAVAILLGFAFFFGGFVLLGEEALFGLLSDVAAMFIAGGLVPVVWLVFRAHRESQRGLADTSAIVGGFGVALFALGALGLIVAHVMSVAGGQFLGVQYLGTAMVGAWLVLFGVLVLRGGWFPAGLGWLGVISGVSYVLVTGGMVVWGHDHVLVRVAGLVAVLSFVVWGFWLWRWCLQRAKEGGLEGARPGPA